MSALKPGDRLRRRTPLGDNFDLCQVDGFFDTGQGMEVVISPVEHFAESISATSASVRAVYEVEADTEPRAEKWITPANEVRA